MAYSLFAKVRYAAFWASVAAALIVFGVIFVLTEQTPVQTCDLSNAVQDRVSSGVAHGFQHDVLADEATAAGSAADTCGLAAVVDRLLSVAGIRKWAHTAEFFAFGFPVAVASLLWWGRPLLVRWRMLACGVLCALGSLFDQTHKLFVPGREFDAGDLLFDMLGYGLAMIAVFSFAALVRSVLMRRERRS